MRLKIPLLFQKWRGYVTIGHRTKGQGKVVEKWINIQLKPLTLS